MGRKPDRTKKLTAFLEKHIKWITAITIGSALTSLGLWCAKLFSD